MKKNDGTTDIVASAPTAPTPGPALPNPPAAWPAFTCVVCEDVYPASSFKRDGDKLIPQLKGALRTKGEASCLCATCTRAAYRMLQNGELG